MVISEKDILIEYSNIESFSTPSFFPELPFFLFSCEASHREVKYKHIVYTEVQNRRKE